MNKYSKTFLLLCSTLGLSIFTSNHVLASSFTSANHKPIEFDLFIEENLDNVLLSKNGGDILIDADKSLAIVTDSSIPLNSVKSNSIMGIDFTNILGNGDDLTIKVDGNLEIFGPIILPGGDLTIDVSNNLEIFGSVASSGTSNSDAGSISINVGSNIKIGEGGTISVSNRLNLGEIIVTDGEISLENTDNIIISENGGSVSIGSGSGGTITIGGDALTITSVPESTSIPSLLLIGAMSTVLAIKAKFKSLTKAVKTSAQT